ncbi:MAG: hypothetical protein WC628_04730 [Candidatus Omnitrophota bacterium]
MSVSREEYKRIIDTQHSGKLTIFIDTSEFRKMFCGRIDPKKFALIVGESAKAGTKLITTLTKIDSVMPVLASVLAILGFGWWGIVGIIGTVVLWGGYKMYACRGKQHVVPIMIALIIMVAIAIMSPLPNIWARWFMISCGVMLFVGRMMYVCTAYIVFSLIETNYEFFNMFYMEPKGAIVPLIWTSELDRDFKKHQ